MRLPAGLVAVLLLVAPSRGASQVSLPARWRLGALLESLHFSRGLVDGSVPFGDAAGLRPSGGLGVGVVLARTSPLWRAELMAGWAAARPQADNAGIAITDRTSRLTRWRLGAAAERRLCTVGAGTLGFAVGPALDWWRIAGEGRLRLGGQAALALHLPMSGWELENRLGLGVSASPFVPEDAGAEFETHALVSLLLGLGVRAPL